MGTHAQPLAACAGGLASPLWAASPRNQATQDSVFAILHAAWGEDRGGNRFQLQAFGRGSNLHAFWDSILIRQAAGGIQAVERDVQQQLNKHAGEKPGEVEQWALESCRIVLQEGFYPSGRDVDQAYVQQHRATVVTRLALASRRLADTINQLAALR